MNKIKILLVCSAVAMAALTGCSTIDGKGRPDPVKLSQAKAIIEPVAAGAIRRVILNSPEHAPEIARYAASVAGVFCEMSLSNQFAPEFLVAALDKYADPKLAAIGDGYLIDVKNAGVGIYKLLWGDRFRAEIPSTNWLHAVCELFCESISEGLSDAGYPGGIKTAKLLPEGQRATAKDAKYAKLLPEGQRATAKDAKYAKLLPEVHKEFGAAPYEAVRERIEDSQAGCDERSRVEQWCGSKSGGAPNDVTAKLLPEGHNAKLL